MLLELARWLAAQDIRFFNVFNYITFRAVLACATALFIGLAAGPRVIRYLAEMNFGQAVRTDGPQTHLVKQGTPTMGGVLILISIAISVLLWADLRNRFVWIVMLVTMGYGWVGWADDYRKVVNRDPNGMPAREKYMWQTIIGVVAAIGLAFSVSAPSESQTFVLFWDWLKSGMTMELPTKADLIVPFFKHISYPLGVFGFMIGRHEQCSEPHRWFGWLGDYANGDGRLGTGLVCLHFGQCEPLDVSIVALHSWLGRGVCVLCGDGGRGFGFPLVQCVSRASVYG